MTKRFADGTVAVEGLNLVCPAGLITVLVGPSGCGKTTSLRMINRMISATGGTIRLGGQDIAELDETSLRRGMGYVIQSAGLFPHRTIIENVATIPVLLGTPKKKARADACELLERVGLDPNLGAKYPYQLSGGQQQRVGVARALAGDPPVLLMDEPFSAVDPVVRAELQTELLRLQQEIEKTIVFVTHDIDEAVRLGDQIAVFMTGGLAQVATPEDILTAPANEFVASFIGGDSGVKWLTLLPAVDLVLKDDLVATARQAETSPEWRLLVDPDRRAVGWLPPNVSPAATGSLISCRRTIDVTADNLRSALDAILLSPCDLAPATDSSGRVLGLADYKSVGDVVRTNRRLPRD